MATRPRNVGRGLQTLGQTVQPRRRVAASFYTGSGGGSCGLGLGMTFAELNMGTALGRLPCGTKLNVTYAGKTITVTKTDIGLGGPGIAGLPRAIDLYVTAADALGFPKSRGIIVVEISGAGTSAPTSSSTSQSSDSGQGVDEIFASYTALRDAPRGGRTRPQQQEGAVYEAMFTGGATPGRSNRDGTTDVSFLGGLWNFFKNAIPFFGPTPGAGAPQGAPGAAKGMVTAIPNAFSGVADSINSALDFLKWVAWIFHPVNILRGVEFLVGIALMAFGIHATMQAQREARQGGYRGRRSAARRSALGRATSEATSRTPVGRASRAVRGSRAGRRSARREQRYREYDRSYRRARRTQERKTTTTRTTENARSASNGNSRRKTKARASTT